MEKIQEHIQPYQNGLNLIMVFVIGVTAFLAVFSGADGEPADQAILASRLSEFRSTGRSIDIDVQPEIKEMDELAEQFSSMMREINVLIEEKSEARYREKKAYLKMLTVQINPHFLFNALESIRMHSVLSMRMKLLIWLKSLR